jgi:CRP/FNR family transcriptional regulator, cyclic AMP receptor protein
MPIEKRTVGAVERILSLKRIPILAGLAPEDLAVVAKHGRERFFAKGGVLLREGEPIPALYAVLDGKVHLERNGRVMGHVSSGGFVGGPGVFARDPQGLSATAETDTLVLEVETDAALEIFEDSFAILHHVLREVCRGLIDLIRRLPSHLYRDIFPPAEASHVPVGDLDLVERLLYLRKVSPFVQSSISALAELSRGMAEVVFPPGTRLWEEGEASGTVIMVVSGTVTCGARKGEAVFTTGPGALLGAVESMAERPRWHTATTETRVTALQGSIEGLIDVFEDNFEMAMDYLAVMARAQIRLLEMRVSESGRGLEHFYGSSAAAEEPPPTTKT